MNLLSSFSSALCKKTFKEIFTLQTKNNFCKNIRIVRLSMLPRQHIRPLERQSNFLINVGLPKNSRFYSENLKLKVKSKDTAEKVNLWKSVLITLGVGAICTVAMLHFKKEKDMLIEKERKRTLGKASIGGKFELVDQNNEVRKSEDFIGTWLLIYFGFTHCPDICPEEIEKMVEVVDKIEKFKSLPKVVPIFITVDPVRDTASVVGKYVKEFSDKIIGLTGSVEQIAAVCKAYRVYFSAGPKDQDSDYLVDHSIIMYLVNPDGDFMDYYGQNKNSDQIIDSIRLNIAKYEGINKKGLLSWL